MPTKLDLSSFRDAARRKQSKLGSIRKVEAEVVEDASDFHNASVFVYKGQKYDALSILSLPLGASKKEIKQAYASKLMTSPEEAELVVKAFEKLS